MPIYEFYCPECHMLFNFFSHSINTSRRPGCPKCKRKRLQRQVSAFATTGKAGEVDDSDDLPVDESRMEQAMETLAADAESMSEDDPRQAAELMRKFSKLTGLEFGDGVEEAIGRMEAGEDPDAIEAELGDRIENEEPFVKGGGRKGRGDRRRPPKRDETLYDL